MQHAINQFPYYTRPTCQITKNVLTTERRVNCLKSGWNGRCKLDRSQRSFPLQESELMNGSMTASWRTRERKSTDIKNQLKCYNNGSLLIHRSLCAFWLINNFKELLILKYYGLQNFQLDETVFTWVQRSIFKERGGGLPTRHGAHQHLLVTYKSVSW